MLMEGRERREREGESHGRGDQDADEDRCEDAGVVRGEEVARRLFEMGSYEGAQRQSKVCHQPYRPGGERGQRQREGEDAGESGARPGH
jgi:hypothetical protein